MSGGDGDVNDGGGMRAGTAGLGDKGDGEEGKDKDADSAAKLPVTTPTGHNVEEQSGNTNGKSNHAGDIGKKADPDAAMVDATEEAMDEATNAPVAAAAAAATGQSASSTGSNASHASPHCECVACRVRRPTDLALYPDVVARGELVLIDLSSARPHETQPPCAGRNACSELRRLREALDMPSVAHDWRHGPPPASPPVLPPARSATTITNDACTAEKAKTAVRREGQARVPAAPHRRKRKRELSVSSVRVEVGDWEADRDTLT
jgi:hypothetical protein